MYARWNMQAVMSWFLGAVLQNMTKFFRIRLLFSYFLSVKRLEFYLQYSISTVTAKIGCYENET